MLALRSLVERWPADHRARLALAAVVLSFGLVLAVLAGIGAWAVWGAGALVLAALPWAFVSAGRPYLADDAMGGVPFAWRGERAGVWATAPAAGFLLALALAQTLDLGAVAAVLGCPLAAVAYTWLLAWTERRHEHSILLDLAVLEQRFEQITDARAPAAHSAAPDPQATQAPDPQATQEYIPVFADDEP